MKASFSVMKITDPKKAGKSYELINGALRSDVDGRYKSAEASTVQVGTVDDLRSLWESLTANNCILQGVTPYPKVKVRPEAADRRGAGASDVPIVPRSNEAFKRPNAPGIMIIDTDEEKSLCEVLSKLHDACPALADVACVQASSTGARIFDASGVELKGNSGTHTIYLVKDASDIPRALEVLHKRLWLTGHGWIKLAETGEMMVRSAADLAMRVPSQPLYIRAHLGQGLEQRKLFKVYSNSDTCDFLDTRTALPDLSADDERRLAELIQDKQRAMQPQAEAKRHEYKSKFLAEQEAKGMSTREALALFGSAYRSKDLYGNWLITLSGGKQITVQDILNAPAKYHGKSCRDPLEPDYGGKTVATIYSNQAKPIINSHAHGGREFFLHSGEAPEAVSEPDRLDGLQDAPASSASEKRAHPLARFVDYDFKPRPPRFVIPDLIDNGLVTIAGAHGVGKTSTVLPLAMVAAGLHRPDEMLAPKVWRHVVYVCEDIAQAQRIITGVVRYGGLDADEETVKERLHLVEAQRLPPNEVAQVGAVYKSEFTRLVDDVEIPPLVVLDTSAAVLDIEDTNANAKVSQAMYALKQGFSGLPVWVVCHVSKAVKNRKDLSDLSALGGVAFEADSVQNLYLIIDGGKRHLVLGKCRFEKRWPELEILSDYATEDVIDEHGQRVTLPLRWSFAQPSERSRTETRQQREDEERKQAEIALRDEVLTTVEAEARKGTQVNRATLKAMIRRRASDVVGCIEILLSEQWLDEVAIPPKDRKYPRQTSYLVKRSTEEREALLRSQETITRPSDMSASTG